MAREKIINYFWPEEIDFVRAAAKFDALIVPFGAVGAADSVTFFRDKTGEQPQHPVGAALGEPHGGLPVPAGRADESAAVLLPVRRADCYQLRGRVGSHVL